MTTNMLCMRFALAAAVTCGALACGDDDDSSGGGSGSAPKINVAPSKPLAMLDMNDVKQVCDALADVANQTVGADSQRFSCTLAGALAGLQAGANGMTTVDKTKCKKAMDDCLAMTSSSTATTVDVATCNMAEATSELKDCTATVGELQSCLDATVDTFHQLLGSLSCDNVMVSVTTQPTTQSPPACRTLQMKCPNLKIGGDSSSTKPDMTPSPTGCDDTCTGNAKDGFCDDGGSGSDDAFCGLGTDCTDCGKR